MNELSLFSGHCGFTLGLRLAGLQIRTVGYVDNESFIQKLIAQRIKDGFLDAAPIFGDVRAFLSDGYARSYHGLVDVLTAGFPCQPHSAAGRRLGASDPRNLWPELAECIGLVRPRGVLLENVPGLIDGAEPYVAVVVGDLARIGYDARWGLVPAAAVGAPHLRWRWWCLAYPQRPDVSQQQGRFGQQRPTGLEQRRQGASEPSWDGEAWLVADASSQPHRLETYRSSRQNGESPATFQSASLRQEYWQASGERTGTSDPDVSDRTGEQVGPAGQPRKHECMGDAIGAGLEERQGVLGDDGGQQPPTERTGWWAVEPALGRVASRTSDRVAQLRAAGNGIVPAVVAEFLRRIGG